MSHNQFLALFGFIGVAGIIAYSAYDFISIRRNPQYAQDQTRRLAKRPWVLVMAIALLLPLIYGEVTKTDVRWVQSVVMGLFLIAQGYYEPNIQFRHQFYWLLAGGFFVLALLDFA
jgi:hypothetical protein